MGKVVSTYKISGVGTPLAGIRLHGVPMSDYSSILLA